jgi:Ca2+-binding RTX toxin-like protein
LVETTGNGGLTINSAVVTNDGNLLAAGGTLTVTHAVTGDGLTTLSGSGGADFGGDGTHQDVLFATVSNSKLELDHSQTYTGAISGFNLGDSIDLHDISFAAATTTAVYTPTSNAEGTLVITDTLSGNHATLDLLGTYVQANFHITDDGSGHTLLTDPPATDKPSVHLVDYGNGGDNTLNSNPPNGDSGTDTVTFSAKSAVSFNAHNAGASSILASEGDSQNVSGMDYVAGGDGNDVIIGTKFNDTLFGNTGNNTLDGGAGNDILTGGAGNDTFVHKTGYGTDTVTDYQPGHDHFDLTETGIHAFSDLSMTQVGKDVHISFGGGDELDIAKTTIATLTAHSADFIFH